MVLSRLHCRIYQHEESFVAFFESGGYLGTIPIIHSVPAQIISGCIYFLIGIVVIHVRRAHGQG